MTKKSTCARNWKRYNRSLIARGNITLWIDRKSINDWYENTGSPHQRGRRKIYSDSAITLLLVFKQLFHLTLRSSTGFVESLFKMNKLLVKVPCYTRICRRQKSIKLPSLPTCKKPIHLVLDSTGLKIFGEGEWKVRQHGWSKHRMWRKLHLGVDEKSQLIVSALLTKNDCGDDKKLPVLLERYQGKIKQVSADGAYDSHACFDTIASKEAKATIPTQPNPKHKRKRKKELKRIRDHIAWQIQTLGRKRWKQENNVHRRSIVENTYYRYKTLFGSKLSSRKLENQQTEAIIRCHLLNIMTIMNSNFSSDSTLHTPFGCRHFPRK